MYICIYMYTHIFFIDYLGIAYFRHPSQFFSITTARLTEILAANLASRMIFKPIGWLEFDKNSATQPAKPKFYYIMKLKYTVAEQIIL